MFTKFKSSIFALVFVISLAFTSQLTAVNTTLENPTLVGSKHMSIIFVEQKKPSKKKRKKKKNVKKKKASKKRKAAKKKKASKKRISKKAQKKNPPQQNQPQQRQQRQQQLADVKQEIKNLRDEFGRNVRSSPRTDDARIRLTRNYYTRLTPLFIQKITVEAALDGRLSNNPSEEFHNIIRSLVTIIRERPETDRTKQSIFLAVQHIMDDDENVRQEAYDRLVRDYNNLLNDDVEGYINQAIMTLIYALYHDLL